MMQYQFTTVPHMVFIPSGTKKVTKFRDDQYFRNPQANIYDIIDFVNRKTGVEVWICLLIHVLNIIMGYLDWI